MMLDRRSDAAFAMRRNAPRRYRLRIGATGGPRLRALLIGKILPIDCHICVVDKRPATR